MKQFMKKYGKKMKRAAGFVLAGVLGAAMLTGCGAEKEEIAKNDKTKIGVLVADVSGEEALGFRSYYENYITNHYDVEFSYTDALESAEDEKIAIEKFVSQGCDAIISLASNDRAQQIETCEKYGVYYAIASGVLDDEQYEAYKTNEHFVGQVGPSNETEFETGKQMGAYYKEQGVSKVALYGAFIPNPMHVYRVAGTLAGLGCTYGGTDDMDAVAGQIFQDQTLDLSKVAGDIEIVSYLQGYGDTTTDELNAAIQKNPDAFLSVGMATTFFAQSLNEAKIPFSDIDSFTEVNGKAMREGSLTYIAGKYSSSIGPVFALVMNAVSGNVIRDEDGNAPSLSQSYLVATDSVSFDTYYVSDNGSEPIYDKEVVDKMIGADVTFDDIRQIVETM